MAILSAYTLIRAISLFHVTAAYIFLTNPRLLSEQTAVLMLGEAMQIPASTTLTKPSEALALFALLLAFVGATDLLSASLPTLTALEYWSAQVPVRLVLLFAITAYTYLFSPEGIFGDGGGAFGALTSGTKAAFGKGDAGGARQLVVNDLVFTAGFLEVCAWFYVYVLLKEERQALAQQIVEKRKLEEDML